MKRAWIVLIVFAAACGGWDQIAAQSRVDRCRAVPDECDAGPAIEPDDAGTDPGLDGGTDAGQTMRCTSSSQCDADAGLFCHPTAGICARGCSGVDPTCTVCDYPPGFNFGQRFCGCSASTGCGAGFVCSTFDGVCTPRCGTCPAGRTCSVGSGQCAAPEGCVFGSCPTGTFCDSRTRVCSSFTCDAALPQPGTCSYGAYCTMTGRCAEPPRATCANLDGGPSPWTPTSTGNVIFAARPIVADAGSCFAGQRAFGAVLSVYSLRPMPADKSNLDWAYYPAGAAPLPGSLYVSSYAPDGSVAELTVGVCDGAPQLTLAWAFDGGNPVCLTLDGGVPR